MSTAAWLIVAVGAGLFGFIVGAAFMVRHANEVVREAIARTLWK